MKKKNKIIVIATIAVIILSMAFFPTIKRLLASQNGSSVNGNQSSPGGGSGFFAEEKQYINRGISGQTTPQMLLRFRQDVLNLWPKVVVILAGVNDIAGNTGPSSLEMIEDNIHSMTELAQAHGIQVVLCSVLPAYDFPWRPGLEPAPKIVELNRRIKEYASKKGAVYCDYFSAMADERNGLPEELSGDGVHPNKKGYEIMQPIVENAIARALIMWKEFK
jgi:lysophospholipase L1-like esterase